jgi:hypothetical protein
MTEPLPHRLRFHADGAELLHLDQLRDLLREAADRIDALEASTLSIVDQDGGMLASFTPEESALLIDTAIHQLFDTVIIPHARRVITAHGEPHA